MLFHAHKHALNFELEGHRYIVPLGSTFDVPNRIAYCIEAHGIAAAKGPAANWKRGDDVIVGEPDRKGAHRRPHIDKDERVTKATLDEELADVTGEDPLEEDAETGERIDDERDEADGDISDGDAAAKTLASLEAQGVRVPGKRPGRKRGNQE